MTELPTTFTEEQRTKRLEAAAIMFALIRRDEPALQALTAEIPYSEDYIAALALMRDVLAIFAYPEEILAAVIAGTIGHP